MQTFVPLPANCCCHNRSNYIFSTCLSELANRFRQVFVSVLNFGFRSTQEIQQELKPDFTLYLDILRSTISKAICVFLSKCIIILFLFKVIFYLKEKFDILGMC